MFRVYGDDNMFQAAQASKGLAHSGETSHRSRNSILQILRNGVESTGHTTQDILKRVSSEGPAQHDV